MLFRSPAAKKNVPKIDVSFDIDQNGILKVGAIEKAGGSQAGVTISSDQNRLTKEQIDQMVEDSKKFAEEDKNAKVTAEARRELREYLEKQKNFAGLDKLKMKDRRKHQKAVESAYDFLKNNDKAKKVGMMLEKLARGMVHRIFTAFIRHFQEMAEERAAQDAINARLSGLDEANRAKLKVFLMGKEKAQLMMFFKQWVQVASEKGLMELYEMLDKEEAMRIAAEAELAALLGASGDVGSELNDLQHQIDAENQAAIDLVNKAHSDAGDLRRITKKIRECEADVKQEQEYRQEQQEKNLAIREETAASTAVRDELAAELMGVAGDVGNVHTEAQYAE